MKKEELSVFIASPNDVTAERESVERVLEAVNLGMATDRNIIFKSYRWENEYPRAGAPQPIFTQKISECILFVAIFWRRIGKSRGKKCPSTVEEVQEALKLFKNNGAPSVMIYFSNKQFVSSDPNDYIQKAHVLDLKSKMENDPLWQNLYKTYSDVNEFEFTFRKDFEKWLHEYYPISRILEKSGISKSYAKIKEEDNLNFIWSQCLTSISEKINIKDFTTWFKPIKPIKIANDKIIIKAPSHFYAESIDNKYGYLIQKVLRKLLKKDIQLNYLVGNEVIQIENKEKHEVGYEAYTKSNLIKRFTFDNFVEGSSNQFARAAALAVSDHPGRTSFNPLVLYSEVGLGKTHLLQAIGNYAILHGTAKNVIYVTSEKFTTNLINAIQDNKTDIFNNKYRSVNLFLVDDIQYLMGKERTQEEFFNIFNELYQKSKQIVLSSDRSPKELRGLQIRLLSRFQWGLVVDIQPPDLETRIAILKRKIAEISITIPEEVIYLIAQYLSSNVRELEGALIKMLAYSSLRGQEITLDIAKLVLKDQLLSDQKLVTIEEIWNIVGKYYNIPQDNFPSKRRNKEITYVRQVAMYLSRVYTRKSLKSIGLIFGGRSDGSVKCAINTINKKINTDKIVRGQISILKHKIEMSVKYSLF